MAAPTPSSSERHADAAPSAPERAGSSDVVVRPEPGLRRGVWEAPPWAFWAALAVGLAVSTAYLLHRLGIVRLWPLTTGKRPSGEGSQR